MDVLDLSTKPPRPPRAELGGIIFLPRSIDKARATLPGGDPGPYVLRGFTTMMLEHLEISEAAFVGAVAAAASDADVLSFVNEHSSAEHVAAWNAFVSARQPRNGDRVAALESYPWLGERPDLIIGLDVLAEDDIRYFNDLA
jgi:hypothetical protein